MQVILPTEQRFNQRYMRSMYFNLCVYFFVTLAAGSVFSYPASAQAEQGLQRDIPLNQIVEIKLPENAATVLLGNPDIADILSQGRSSVVIGGKRIGLTNLLVKDRDQTVIRNIEISVSPSNIRTITIFRGAERTDFSCGESCEIQRSSDQGAPQTASSIKPASAKP